MDLTPRLLALAMAFVCVVAIQSPSLAAQASAPKTVPAPAKPSSHAPQTPAPNAVPQPAPAKPVTPYSPAAQASAPKAAPAQAPKTAPSAPVAPIAPVAPVAPVATRAAIPAGPQLEPQGFTYDPEGRRDPFVSLLRRGNEAQKPTLGSRPAGLSGLETSEVTLKGTLNSQGAYVGILQGADNKTYIVKAGDKLLDGEIRTITPDSMVITQQVTDPLSLEKQREVRKVLRPTEDEAK